MLPSAVEAQRSAKTGARLTVAVVSRPRSAATIGRARELATLVAAQRALSSSRGTLVLVSGEAGVGKTRLLDDFLAAVSAATRARHVVRVACLPGPSRPYGVLRAVVAALAPHADSVPPLAQRAAAQILGAPSVPPLDAADVRSGAVAYVRAVSLKRAVVIVADDLQWADPSSLGVLEELASRIAGTRTLIVATVRKEALVAATAVSEALARLVRAASVVPLELAPLSAAEIRTLVVDAAGAHVPAENVVRSIAELSGGNPFFAEELLASAQHARSKDLPATVRAAIAERLALLDPASRAIVRDAAVIGARVDAAVIADVFGASRGEVDTALERARDAGVLDVDDTGQLRFGHELIRRVLMEIRPADEVRHIHGRLVTAYEGRHDDERYLPELAYHAWRADDRLRSARFNRRLGERALAARALPEATRAFERVLATEPAGAERAEVLEQLATSLSWRGELEQSLDAYERALEERLRRRDYDDAARVMRALLADLSNGGRARLVQARADAFLSEYGSVIGRPAHDELVAFLARWTSAASNEDGTEQYLRSIAEPLALDARARTSYEAARLNRAVWQADLSQWQDAARALERLAPDIPPFLATINALTVAQTGVLFGVHDAVERALLAVRRTLADGSFGSLVRFAAAVEAAYDARCGRLVQARANIERALAGSPGVANVLVATFGSSVARALGDAALAERCLDAELVRDARMGRVSADDALILTCRAEHMADADPAGALRDLRLAFEATPAATPERAPILLAAAERLEEPSARRAARLAAAAAHRGSVMRASADLVRACVAARFDAGDPEAAESAAALYRELGWSLHEALALERAGRHAEAASLRRACAGEAPPELRRGIALPTDEPARRLTERQSAVADLVGAGATNAAIARRLGVSEGTVEKHLTAIFARLGIRSRTELAARVARLPQR